MKIIFLLVTIICASSAGCQHPDSKARFLVEANNFLNYPLGSYSYIDRSGKTAIPGEFCYAGKFHEGVALAMRDCSKLKAEGEWRDVSLEFIRNDGKVVLEIKGDLLKEITFSYLSDGLISIKRGQFCGYVDQQGKTVIDFVYEYCPPFKSGFAYVGKGNKYYLLNKFGEIVNLSPAGYDHFWGCASDICLFSYKAGSKSQSYAYRFFDTGKKRFIGNKYQNARPFSSGLAAVQQKGLWGFINTDGKLAIAAKYRETRNFSDKLAAVKASNADNWFFVDVTGKRISPETFDRVTDFENGLVWAGNASKGNCYLDTKLYPVHCIRISR